MSDNHLVRYGSIAAIVGAAVAFRVTARLSFAGATLVVASAFFHPWRLRR